MNQTRFNTSGPDAGPVDLDTLKLVEEPPEKAPTEVSTFCLPLLMER